MNTPCRVSADLRDLAAREDKAEVRQYIVDAYAIELFEYMTDGGFELDLWLESLDDKDLREVFGEYLGRKYATRERGVTDDRYIIARDYLEGVMRKWCDRQAAEQMAQREIE